MTLLSYSASTALLADDSAAMRIGVVLGTSMFPAVARTDASADFTVVKRADAADLDLCPPGTKQRIWSMPPRTDCTEPPSWSGAASGAQPRLSRPR